MNDLFKATKVESFEVGELYTNVVAENLEYNCKIIKSDIICIIPSSSIFCIVDVIYNDIGTLSVRNLKVLYENKIGWIVDISNDEMKTCFEKIV